MTITPLEEVSIEAEYNAIVEVLKEVDFNKSKAATILQIDRKTLYNKIRIYKEMKAGQAARAKNIPGTL